MAHQKMYFIVADDEIRIVDGVSRDLEALARTYGDSIEIYKASDGSDVLRLLKQKKVDALFLDYHFPNGMSGAEVLKSIEKKSGKYRVVIMSGYKEDDLKVVVNQGFNQLGEQFSFLDKPFKSTELLSEYLRIRNWVAKQPYPLPLAYFYETLTLKSTAQGRVTAMKDFIEAVIKFSFAIFISDLERLRLLDEFVSQYVGEMKLSIKNRLVCLNNLGHFLKLRQEELFMPELLDLFGDREDPNLQTLISFHDSVQEAFNRDFSRDDRWYARLFNRYKPALDALYEQLSFMKRYELITVDEIDIVDEGILTFQYKVRSLTGAVSNFSTKIMESPQPLARHESYIIDPHGKFLSLSPWIIFRFCEDCSSERLFILDSLEPTKLQYHGFCNDRWDDEREFSNIDKKYAQLFPPAFQGPYQFIGIPRSTAHSQVREAWDLDLKRKVAIKSFLMNGIEMPGLLSEERLQREAEIQASLNHPNIGKVVHLLHNPLRIVMEWIEGESLQEILKEGKYLPVSDVISIGMKLAAALELAHDRGVIHRDVKPSNIILRDHHEPILIDFDIAHLQEFRGNEKSQKANGVIDNMFTPEYSAPEQFEDKKEITPAADIFSLGVVLYELLTHHMPYPNGNDLSLYNGSFEEPKQKQIPDDLYEILLEMLQAEPGNRMTAKALFTRLKTILPRHQN